MAMLYAQRIMLGKMKFSDLKKFWKPKVYEILVESDAEELCEGWKPEQK